MMQAKAAGAAIIVRGIFLRGNNRAALPRTEKINNSPFKPADVRQEAKFFRPGNGKSCYLGRRAG